MQKTREYNPKLCEIAGFSVARFSRIVYGVYKLSLFSVNFTSLRHICLQSTISWQVDLVYRLLQHQGCVEIHCVQNMRQLWQAVALTSMDQF